MKKCHLVVTSVDHYPHYKHKSPVGTSSWTVRGTRGKETRMKDTDRKRRGPPAPTKQVGLQKHINFNGN